MLQREGGSSACEECNGLKGYVTNPTQCCYDVSYNKLILLVSNKQK